jgi:hypothetical protein
MTDLRKVSILAMMGRLSACRTTSIAAPCLNVAMMIVRVAGTLPIKCTDAIFRDSVSKPPISPGARNGKDVLIALSYGLKAVGLGRVCVAGLGAGGCAGMRRAFEIIRAEFERSMRLVGVRSVDEIRADGIAIRRRNLLIGNSWLPDFVF